MGREDKVRKCTKKEIIKVKTIENRLKWVQDRGSFNRFFSLKGYIQDKCLNRGNRLFF